MNSAIDLDTPNDESLDADDGENVLSCHEISNFLQEEPLQEWNVFHPGSETFEVCLAEDGMPLIDEPMSHHEHQCFMLEVPMSRQDLIQWSQATHPEELAQVASAGNETEQKFRSKT